MSTSDDTNMNTLDELFKRNILERSCTDEELEATIARLREVRKQRMAARSPKFSSFNKLNEYAVQQIGAALALSDEDAIKAIRELWRDEYEAQAKLIEAKVKAKVEAKATAQAGQTDQAELDLDERTSSTCTTDHDPA
jgi:hypothetical protein